MRVKCNECGEGIELSDPKPGDHVQCPKCEIRMKVVSVNVNRVYLETVDEEIGDIEDPEEEAEQ